MLTKTNITEYLTSQGMTLPDFVIDLIIDQSAIADECMTLNYSEGTIDLIKLQFVLLLALGQQNQYVTAQRAPSGASRSFQFKELSSRWNYSIEQIRSLDTKKCLVPFLPNDPSQLMFAGVWSIRGGNLCE